MTEDKPCNHCWHYSIVIYDAPGDRQTKKCCRCGIVEEYAVLLKSIPLDETKHGKHLDATHLLFFGSV